MSRTRFLNTLKSHHNFEFIAPFIEKLQGKMDIVYVHRHPADVMRSFWKFLPTWPWAEGPVAKSPVDFALSAPMGNLMRYQYQQHDSMLDRWASHVGLWCAVDFPNVHVIRYEDLDEDYESTIRSLGDGDRVGTNRIR